MGNIRESYKVVCEEIHKSFNSNISDVFEFSLIRVDNSNNYLSLWSGTFTNPNLIGYENIDVFIVIPLRYEENGEFSIINNKTGKKLGNISDLPYSFEKGKTLFINEVPLIKDVVRNLGYHTMSKILDLYPIKFYNVDIDRGLMDLLLDNKLLVEFINKVSRSYE